MLVYIFKNGPFIPEIAVDAAVFHVVSIDFSHFSDDFYI